jgi:hypothetical protein
MERSSLSAPQVVVGVIIIAIGVLFLLDNMGYVYADDFLPYWPVLLIAYGISKVASPAGRGWGAIVGIIGVLFLLQNLDVMDVPVWSFWPVLLILMGALLLYRGTRRPGGSTAPGGETSADQSLHGFAFLGGFKRSITSQSFEGGHLTACLGGCEVDLSGANMKGERAVLDVLAFMGGIELRVPASWRVELQGTPILGGFADETRRAAETGAKVLVVKGLAVFGGVDVKN